MKTRTIFSLAILLFILPSIPGLAQKADLTGEWKLNKEKSVIADQLFLSKITIQFKSDSLISDRVYENGNGEEYPFVEKLSLDGKDCKTVIYDMPRTSSATRSADGSVMISSATTYNGNNGQEDMIAKETWKADSSGKVLILDFTNKMQGNEIKGTFYYDKVK
jgi:hypothetical protein